MTTRTTARGGAARKGGRSPKDPSVPTRLTPAVVTGVTAVQQRVVRLDFDARVQLSRTPGFRAGAGGAEAVVSAAAVGPRTVELTFAGNVAGTTLLVGEYDPGVRTASGGFVPAGRYAIPPITE